MYAAVYCMSSLIHSMIVVIVYLSGIIAKLVCSFYIMLWIHKVSNFSLESKMLINKK